jgi:hypothetical protein
VTITGSNFAGASSVKLGATPAKFTVNSSTKITATVPSIARLLPLVGHHSRRDRNQHRLLPRPRGHAHDPNEKLKMRRRDGGSNA